MTKPDEVRFSARFAPDEPDLYSVEGQQIVQAFTQELRGAGLNPSTRMFFRDAAGGGATSLGEYLVPLADFAKIAVPVVVAWLTGRAGRKIEFQSGDIKVTAYKREDVETLVRLAQEASRKTDTDEQTPAVDPADRAE